MAAAEQPVGPDAAAVRRLHAADVPEIGDSLQNVVPDHMRNSLLPFSVVMAAISSGETPLISAMRSLIYCRFPEWFRVPRRGSGVS